MIHKNIFWHGRPMEASIETCDVLIIGCGLAALYTALSLDHGLSVVMLSKSGPESSNSMRAQGGIAAALDSADHPDLHYADSIRAGAEYNKPEAVRVLVDEGPGHIFRLQEWGVPFDCDENGRLQLGREAAHSKPRIVHCQGDSTGLHVTRTLLDRAQASANIRFAHYWALADFLHGQTGRINGALAISTEKAEQLRIFKARHIVLASGGFGGLYQRTTNHPALTGDGLAAALRAGAQAQSLEFIQFHPTALYLPEQKGSCFLISEAVRGEGAVLRNRAGQRFMTKEHPLADLAPRDIVARSIARQMIEDQSEHVWLDVTQLDSDHIRKRFPSIYGKCLEEGYDLTRDWLPVSPAQHYCMGGVTTDLNAQTSLPGLFACGEVAWTGVYGANRLASNSLLECLVFGFRAARTISAAGMPVSGAAEVDVHVEKTAADSSASISADMAPADLATIRAQLAQQMTSHCGILRKQKNLQALLTFIGQAESQTRHLRIKDCATLEIHNLLLCARAVAEAALARPGSLGAHYWIEDI